MKRFHYFALALSVLTISTDGFSQTDAWSVFHSAIEKINMAETITYDYSSFWDNKFNADTFQIDARVIYTRLRSSDTGFGIYMSSGDSEFIYDGSSLLEVDHAEKYVLEYPPEEIASDPYYFERILLFMRNPIQLAREEMSQLSVMPDHEKGSHFIFIRTDSSTSVTDASKIVIMHTEYMIHRVTHKVEGIRTVNMIDSDTSQVISHTFGNISYSDDHTDIAERITPLVLSYPTVTEEDLENNLAEKQIKKGTTLPTTQFRSVTGDTLNIVHKSGNTVLMFSFIGCGGCEYAMKEMKEKEFDFSENIEFFYTSPVDKEQVLRAYLERKGFSGDGFGKSSGMNAYFNAWTFPTFFVVSPNGEILNIHYGYNDEVAEVLFD